MTPRCLGPALIAAALALALTAPAAAQEGLKVTSDSTYRVQPDSGEVDVVIKTKLSNTAKVKGGTRSGFSGWGSIPVPIDAVDLAFKGKKVKAELRSEDSEQRYYTLDFPTIWFRDKVSATTRYTLVDDGPAPGDPTTFRDGYFYVCWPGLGTEKGTARAEIPAGWELYNDGVEAAGVSLADRGEVTVLEAKQDGYIGPRERCTEGFLRETTLLAEGGTPESPVMFVAHAGGETWLADTQDVVAEVLPTFEDLLGPLPTAGDGSMLVIRESAENVYPHASGDLTPADGVLRVSEAFDDPIAAALPLARTWFGPASSLTEPWLREGLAAWIAYESFGQQCPAAPYPAAAAEHYGTPDLDGHWYVPDAAAPASAWDYWDWQHATSCGLVEDAAGFTGFGSMKDLAAELAASTDPVMVSEWIAAIKAAGPDVERAFASALADAGIDPSGFEPFDA